MDGGAGRGPFGSKAGSTIGVMTVEVTSADEDAKLSEGDGSDGFDRSSSS